MLRASIITDLLALALIAVWLLSCGAKGGGGSCGNADVPSSAPLTLAEAETTLPGIRALYADTIACQGLSAPEPLVQFWPGAECPTCPACGAQCLPGTPHGAQLDECAGVIHLATGDPGSFHLTSHEMTHWLLERNGLHDESHAHDQRWFWPGNNCTIDVRPMRLSATDYAYVAQP